MTAIKAILLIFALIFSVAVVWGIIRAEEFIKDAFPYVDDDDWEDEK